jgi:hypothetical protein
MHVRTGTIAAATIVVAAVGAQLLDYGVYDLRVRALDSNADGSLVELLTSAALLGAAVAAWLLARRRVGQAAEIAVAGGLTLLALDRVLGIHEHVPHWRLTYLPILGATALGLVVVARRDEGVAMTAMAGGLLLLGCSLFLHELGDWLAARLGAAPASWPYQLKVGLKHGTEAAGWVLVCLALCHGVAARQRGAPRRRLPTRRARIHARG